MSRGKGINKNLTVFQNITKAFNDIILNIQDGISSSGQKTSLYVQRKTICFKDNSKMEIEEYVNNEGLNRMSHYFYVWMTEDTRVIMEFHSEAHSLPNYKTRTEPYHIHPPEEYKYDNEKMDRLPNFKHQELYDILEFIRLHNIANLVSDRHDT
jgi:hypothetical protein